MASRNVNQYLDISDSDVESDLGHDPEDDELRKGGRQSKRRKIDKDDDVRSAGSDDYEQEYGDQELEAVDEALGLKDQSPKSATVEGGSTAEGNSAGAEKTSRSSKAKATLDLPNTTKPFLRKNLVVTDAAIKQSGVVYLSKIPPYMKPHKLRSLFSPFGTINRVFLVPEDPKVRAKRVRNHGNKKTCYTEGWVEFTRKVDAKRACELLNGRSIGGKKSSYYRDDLWSVIYLKGFKWHHLTEQIAQENAERTARLRAEISRASKQNKEFVKNVMEAKMLDGMQTKAAAKKKRKDEGDKPRPEAPKGASEGGQKTASVNRARSFIQTPLANQRRTLEEQPEQVTRVLGRIF